MDRWWHIDCVLFQFQTGAIKRQVQYIAGRTAYEGFNSKLVRLKAYPETHSSHAKRRFNSKLVRLKGKRRRNRCPRIFGFQFQTGAIKSDAHPNPSDPVMPRFNSKLVRLKEKVRVNPGVNLNGFNSKLVRLKEAKLMELNSIDTSVSIPNWCD